MLVSELKAYYHQQTVNWIQQFDEKTKMTVLFSFDVLNKCIITYISEEDHCHPLAVHHGQLLKK